MVLTFVNRAEFLPEGETLEQHAQWQKEEADIIQNDKANTNYKTGGLFRGCFKHQLLQLSTLRAFRDGQDNVDRCPNCMWELEDGHCAHCDLDFDDEGMAFTGFSDVDETSELDMSEDIDGEIDMDEEDYMDYHGAYPPMYHDEDMDVEHWLAATGQPFPPWSRRAFRRPLHSDAGSRGRPYSASLVSDMHSEDTEMGILEEEDEDDEGLDDDSSMNDFIDDGASEMVSPSNSSSNSESTPSRAIPASQGRRRRVIESQTPSTSGASRGEDFEDEDADDDDEDGPVPNGRQRRQAQLRASQTSRRSSTRSTATPQPLEPGELTQGPRFENARRVLMRQGWSPLDNESTHDEMVEDDYESDSARTTVGWEQTTISNRSRDGGSLTPTADRPNAPIRRVGSSRVLDGSRGLRRRSSVITVSTANYEDGEADDDDSELDGDGDINMNGPILRNRASSIRIQSSVRPRSSNVSMRLENRGVTLGDAIDVESDGSDESTYPAHRRNLPRRRQQEYDPRISYMFAEHQTILREVNLQNTGSFYEQMELEQLRRTPIARPRTANRNRSVQNPMVPAGPSSPVNGHSRMRPSIDMAIAGGVPNSPTSRSDRPNSAASRRSTLADSLNSNGLTLNRQPSVISISSSGTGLRRQPSSLRSPTHPPQSPTSFPDPDGVDDIIERPFSRIGSRPPSAASRRNSGQLMGQFPTLLSSPGLNVAARNMNRHNPFFSVRNRPSSQQLRDQSSTATLRPRPSQRVIRVQPSVANVRDGPPTPQGLRSPPSRIRLRPQPSQHRLQSQPSTRTIRQPHMQSAAQPVPQAARYTSGPARSVASGASGLSEDERQRRASELVRQRAQELGTNPSLAHELGTNPFATAGRRPSAARAESIAGLAMASAERRSSREGANQPSGATVGTIPAGPTPSLAQAAPTVPPQPSTAVGGIGQRAS